MNRRLMLKMTAMAIGSAFLGLGCGLSSASNATTQPSTNPVSEKGELVKVKVYDAQGQLVGPVDMPKVVKTDEQWKAQLSKEAYPIARAKGTEPAFCGNLLDNHTKGIYTCICCGLPLFSSEGKFNSGTGWPSFFQPVAEENVTEHADNSYGMRRTEILCTRCDCHLGHVFDDGPRPTGLRFCVNSASLQFTASEDIKTLADPATK